ncbi:MAG TPA: hypothetical protein VFM38_00925 [Candidatus Limnocylindrales bacterium]|nr:hypothetical protein [Candidatus Limnocylindrales bacterium]
MRPILILNPRHDTEFVERVRRIEENGLHVPGDLSQALRAWYPDVVVRPRELSSEPIVVWYVYRDGRWTSEGSRRQVPDETNDSA